jgi:hypothetical protein
MGSVFLVRNWLQDHQNLKFLNSNLAQTYPFHLSRDLVNNTETTAQKQQHRNIVEFEKIYTGSLVTKTQIFSEKY